MRAEILHLQAAGDDAAERAGVERPANFLRRIREAELRDDADLDACLLCRVDEQIRVIERKAHGLLTDDVLARAHGGNRLLRVQAARRADADGVHLVRGEHILERVKDPYRPGLDEPLRAGPVFIVHADERCFRDLFDRSRMEIGDHAAANECKTYLIHVFSSLLFHHNHFWGISMRCAGYGNPSSGRPARGRGSKPRTWTPAHFKRERGAKPATRAFAGSPGRQARRLCARRTDRRRIGRRYGQRAFTPMGRPGLNTSRAGAAFAVGDHPVQRRADH